MPNTLAHLGVASLVTRAVVPKTDLKWIWLACILPDLPWILQRVMRAGLPDVSPFDLRLYVIVQSSLICSLVLAGAIAVLAKRPWHVFFILSSGILLHLLLDATQTKWANGALLFAPFSWELTNFRLYWPEDWPSQALTVSGAIYLTYAIFTERPGGLRPYRIALLPTLSSAMLGLAYLALPLLWMSAAERNDLHYVDTLRHVEARPGKLIEIDRGRVYFNDADKPVLRMTSGPEFVLLGEINRQAQQISVRGRFVDPDTIAVERVYVHQKGEREIYTLIGLGIVALWWLVAFLRRRLA